MWTGRRGGFPFFRGGDCYIRFTEQGRIILVRNDKLLTIGIDDGKSAVGFDVVIHGMGETKFLEDISVNGGGFHEWLLS